jgi:hypothetical protein
MIFNLLKTRRDDTADTGTYADGVFELPGIDAKCSPRRVRGHVAHQRDYGEQRTVTEVPAGFA